MTRMKYLYFSIRELARPNGRPVPRKRETNKRRESSFRNRELIWRAPELKISSTHNNPASILSCMIVLEFMYKKSHSAYKGAGRCHLTQACPLYFGLAIPHYIISLHRYVYKGSKTTKGDSLPRIPQYHLANCLKSNISSHHLGSRVLCRYIHAQFLFTPF